MCVVGWDFHGIRMLFIYQILYNSLQKKSVFLLTELNTYLHSEKLFSILLMILFT